jgi:alpha-beta hydrolase superfamily lysophospholipase
MALLVAALWLFGPREPVTLGADFDARKFGEGIGVYLESTESGVANLRPAATKRVVWAGQRETRTDLSIVYLHGFSASAEEIRPVPDRLADALGANLVFTRFTGHGRDGAALAQATMSDWMHDTAEALALGRAIGDRVIVIATSTGATFAALAALDPDMRERVTGMVFVAPNFGIKNPMAPFLTWPAARYWVPLVAGRERSFEPLNAKQAAHWTTRYPSAAVFPLAAAVQAAARADYSGTDIPALFYYDADDQVVDATATDAVRADWGGPVALARPPKGPGMDPLAHVIAGDILSPAGTGPAVTAILDWIGGLP